MNIFVDFGTSSRKMCDCVRIQIYAYGHNDIFGQATKQPKHNTFLTVPFAIPLPSPLPSLLPSTSLALPLAPYSSSYLFQKLASSEYPFSGFSNNVLIMLLGHRVSLTIVNILYVLMISYSQKSQIIDISFLFRNWNFLCRSFIYVGQSFLCRISLWCDFIFFYYQFNRFYKCMGLCYVVLCCVNTDCLLKIIVRKYVIVLEIICILRYILKRLKINIFFNILNTVVHHPIYYCFPLLHHNINHTHNIYKIHTI